MTEISEKLKAEAGHVVESLASEFFNEGYASGYADGFQAALKSIADYIVSGAAGAAKTPAIVSAAPQAESAVEIPPQYVLEEESEPSSSARHVPASGDMSDYVHEKWRLRMMIRRSIKKGLAAN